MSATPVLTSVAQLAQAIASGDAPRLLDVRWSLQVPDGRGEFEKGHIPGAIYVALDEDLSDHTKRGLGRHPLPEPEALEAAARRWGLNEGDAVVVYDDASGMAAARAWWLLRHAGVANVTILDGALGAWKAAGGTIENGPSGPVAPGNVALSWGHMPVIDSDGAAAFPSHGVLLDARAGERYRGEVEPIDPRAGHIPGALSAPTAGNVDAGGKFLDASALRERFAQLGIGEATPVAAYCGSGVTAAHEIAALAVAGIDAALFPGSWSQWSNDADRPVQVGP